MLFCRKIYLLLKQVSAICRNTLIMCISMVFLWLLQLIHLWLTHKPSWNWYKSCVETLEQQILLSVATGLTEVFSPHLLLQICLFAFCNDIHVRWWLIAIATFDLISMIFAMYNCEKNIYRLHSNYKPRLLFPFWLTRPKTRLAFIYAVPCHALTQLLFGIHK